MRFELPKQAAAAAALGGVITLFGLTMMAGWVFRQESIVRMVPGFLMVFDTALAFAIAGLGLVVGALAPGSRRTVKTVTGIALVVLGSFVYFEHVFKVSLGIDWLELHTWLIDPGRNPFPGRPSPATAVGMVLAGTVFFLVPRVRTAIHGLVVGVLTIATGGIGVLAATGYLLGLPRMLEFYWLTQVSLPTATCFAALALGLWLDWRSQTSSAVPLVTREDERIALAGMLVSAVTSSVVALAIFWPMQSTMENMLAKELASGLKARQIPIAKTMEDAIGQTIAVSERPHVLRIYSMPSHRPGDADHPAMLATIADALVRNGFSAFAFLDASGREKSRVGEFLVDSNLHIPLRHEEHRVELLWSGTFVIEVRADIVKDGKRLGEVRAQQRLETLAQSMNEASPMGIPGEFVLCGQKGDLLQCAPSRLQPQPFETPAVMHGKRLPMTYALEGGTGLIETRDYRGQEVLAAYAPMLGAGLVLKADLRELYAPIRAKLWMLAVTLLLAIATGGLILRETVKPLARHLLHAREQLRVAMEGSRLATWDWNVASGAVKHSDQWTAILGARPQAEETTLEAFSATVHAEDRAGFRESVLAAVQTDARFAVDYRVRHASGEWLWIHSRGQVVERAHDGQALRAIGTSADITERKQSEEKLRANEERFRAVTDTANDGIITINDRGEIVYHNRAAGRIFGYSSEELLGRPLIGLLPERFRIAHENGIKRFLASGDPQVIGRTMELTGLKKEGTEFPLELSLATFQMNGETFFTGFIHDITERKQVEAALAASTAKLQAVMNAALQVSIIATDSQGLITVFNSGAERMLGYRAEEMIGKQTPVILHLESEVTERGRELAEQLGRPISGFDVLVESARRGKPEEREWTYVCKNGSRLTVNLAVTALHDAGGAPSGFLGVAKDITERKRTDAELMRFASELDQRIFAAAAANDALQRETEEMRRLNEERATLGSMNELLLACASPEEAYDVFGRAAAGLFQSSTGALHIFAASRNQLTPAAAWGEWADAPAPFGPESCWGLRRGHYYLGNGTSTPPCEHAGSVQTGATLCVPLMAYGEVLGVLHLRGAEAATLQASLQLVTMANDGLALTLANIKLRQSLKEQSIRDPLTGLFNRRYLTETAQREFARAQRTGASVAIIMIDVDHFKRFNDSFGHDAGDAVLKELGGFFSRSVRTDDIACRYGGEEFCLVLPQMDPFSARQRAEAIRAGAAALEVKSEGRKLGPVTLSLGVALFPDDGGDMESLVRAADAALYEAKQTGRNRVVMTHPAPSAQSSPLEERNEPSIAT